MWKLFVKYTKSFWGICQSFTTKRSNWRKGKSLTLLSKWGSCLELLQINFPPILVKNFLFFHFVENVFSVFTQKCEIIEMKKEYCVSYEQAVHLLSEMQNEQEFWKWLEECFSSYKIHGKVLGTKVEEHLNAQLITPIQRICRYPLLFKEGTLSSTLFTSLFLCLHSLFLCLHSLFHACTCFYVFTPCFVLAILVLCL